MATSVTIADSGEQCPECNGRIDTDDTERVCVECGLVVDSSPVDHGPDWSRSDGDESNQRAYPVNDNLNGGGLGSEMGFHHERDTDDNRRKTWHDRAKTDTKKERNRQYANGEIQRIAEALGLPGSMIDQAKALFKQAHGHENVTVHNLDRMAAVSIYAVARMHQRGITPREVADVARGMEARLMTRKYNRVSNTLGIGAPPPRPQQRARVIASRLEDVDREQTRRVVARLDELPEREQHRGSPTTLAAALLWDETEKTQKRIAEAAGCSPNGIRKRNRMLDEGE